MFSKISEANLFRTLLYFPLWGSFVDKVGMWFLLI